MTADDVNDLIYFWLSFLELVNCFPRWKTRSSIDVERRRTWIIKDVYTLAIIKGEALRRTRWYFVSPFENRKEGRWLLSHFRTRLQRRPRLLHHRCVLIYRFPSNRITSTHTSPSYYNMRVLLNGGRNSFSFERRDLNTENVLKLKGTEITRTWR